MAEFFQLFLFFAAADEEELTGKGSTVDKGEGLEEEGKVFVDPENAGKDKGGEVGFKTERFEGLGRFFARMEELKVNTVGDVVGRRFETGLFKLF